MIKNYIDYWQDVKDATMTTINLSNGNYPNNEWKTKLLISEHSPIRKIKLNWIWKGIKSWISVHFVRHKYGIEHWISTQRDDRTNVNRCESRQDSPVNHEIELNAQACINISKKRLCFQAHTETTNEWKKFLNEVKKVEPELYYVCVPDCVYRCACPEIFGCPFFASFSEVLSREELLNINERYKKYNEIR